MTQAGMLHRFAVLAALAALLPACAAEPTALYFTPGKQGDFALCGKPAPAGDATSDFNANGRKYRMLWVKGTLCEFSADGAFLKSYVWGAPASTATHVMVDRSGTLEEDLTFGPVAATSTEARVRRAAVIDAAALAALLGAIALALFLRRRRRAAPASGASVQAGSAIIVEDGVFPDLNVVRALGAGAVLGVTNRLPVNVVDPRHPEAEMKALLGDDWYIFNADDLEHAFTSLLETGHAERFDWLIARSLGDEPAGDTPDQASDYFDEPTEYDESAANLGPAVQWLRERGYVTSDDDLRRGTAGYDIDRAVLLARAGLGAGYISRRNALGMVMYAGEHARMRFASWREFATSVLLGRAIWGGVADPAGQFAERAAVVDMLLTDPRSPWLTAGWWPPREVDAEVDDAGSDSGPPSDGFAPTLH